MGNRLIITGCGYSGTHYVAKVLERAGLAVGHERAFQTQRALPTARWDRDVDVSWIAAGYRLSGYGTAWTLVRHPLAVARSLRDRALFHRPNRYTRFVAEALGRDPQASTHPELEYWLLWTALSLHQAERAVRLEDLGRGPELDALVREASRVVGYRGSPDLAGARATVPQNRWTGERRPYDPQGYKRLDQVASLAADLGYVVEPHLAPDFQESDHADTKATGR